MAAPVIQPFPPGMALPAPGGIVPADRPARLDAEDPFAPAIDADLARLRDRRRRLIARLGGLPPRSRHRAELVAELRVVTAAMLRIETR